MTNCIVSSIFVIVFVCQSVTDAAEQNKRLLLTDPDLMMSKLIQMEKHLQDVTRVTTQLQTELTHEKTENSKMKMTISQLHTKLEQELNQGSTYIRWGRKQCSALGTEMVYSGYTAGQDRYRSSTSAGGPANVLCLPNNPELSNRTTSGSSYIDGSEYEDGDIFKKGAQDEDVPCALCRSRNTSTSVMIPGRRTCYQGWKTEYRGILTSGYHGHRPSSYLCLDNDPEFLQKGQADEDGYSFYATSAKCGSLPCPPYSNSMAVNCVVCSK